DQPLERGRSPVAVERSEKQLTEPPAGVDVRLGGPARDDAVLLAVVVRIVLEARVEVRVGDHGDGAEQGLDRESGGRRPVSGTGRPQRITPSLKIGRASCRGRGERSVVAGGWKENRYGRKQPNREG